MESPRLVPLAFVELSIEHMRQRAEDFRAEMTMRRSVRHFSPRPVPRALIEAAIATASSAPSGANLQPWTFVVVEDAETKRRIREKAEEEERRNYGGRMPPEWLEVLAPLGTDEIKAHITDAPFVVVLFRQMERTTADGGRHPTYYSTESVGIAAGIFIAAIHHMGLATLTHTPSPMGFLSAVLERPSHERPFLLMPVGYPAPGAVVPDIGRKPLSEVLVWR